jgi:membrane-bound metal-dependent hydrolase YbcI (DUF457 family)
MFAGHFGVAAAARAVDDRTPLWALVGASQALDIAFVPLAAAGVESIDEVDGASGYGAALITAEWTHSLVGAAALAFVLGLLARRRWGRRSGLVVGALVASHRLLDLVVHRPDLPLLPGNAASLPLLGLGLWRIPAAAAVVEAALVVVGVAVYVRTIRPGPEAAADDRRRAVRATSALTAVCTFALVGSVLA